MHVLFVHQNFPAQFRHLAPALAAQYGWRCTFATARDDARSIPGVEKVVYRPLGSPARDAAGAAAPFDAAVAHALGVYEALKDRPDVRPDLVVAHSGFGSSLYLPYLYDAPIINYFEYFFRPAGQSLGYRPDVPVTERALLRTPVRDAMVLLDLANCDRGWCPNKSQRDAFPPEYHGKIEVVPDGIDTHFWRPREFAPRRLPHGTLVAPGTRIVTYVARGLEMMRGFDVFMRAAKLIYRRGCNS